jgi:hypothetical protein
LKKNTHSTTKHLRIFKKDILIAKEHLIMANSLLDYLPLVKKTLIHWQQVETKTGKAFLLRDKTTRADLEALHTRLVALQSQNLTESNDRQRAQETRDGAIQALHPLVKQARTSLKGLTESTPGSAALPELLPSGSDPQKYLQAARDIAEIWATVNAGASEPLTVPVLEGETTVQITQAQFVGATAAYTSAVETLVAARTTEALGKKTRDNLHKTAKAKLLAYSPAAKARLADGDPLRTTIPTLSG